MTYNPEHRNFYGVVLNADEVVGSATRGRGVTKCEMVKRKITFTEYTEQGAVVHTAFAYGHGHYMHSTSGGIHADGTQYVDIIKDGRGTVIAIRKSEGA